MTLQSRMSTKSPALSPMTANKKRPTETLRAAKRLDVTLRAAERITGLTITSHGNGEYCGRGDGEFWVQARDEKDAASRIIDQHWRYVCQIRARQQNFRCAYCDGIRPLQGHHKQLRSHVRIDSVGNTDMLCQPCHDAKFGPHGRRS